MAFGNFVQAATAVDGNNTVVTIGGAGFASNVTAGNLLVLFLRIGGASPSPSVTSNSTPATFTKAVEQVQTSDGHKSFIFYGLNQAGGVKPTITITISPSASIRALLCEYSGDANTVLDVVASAQQDAPGTGANACTTGATSTRASARATPIPSTPSPTSRSV